MTDPASIRAFRQTSGMTQEQLASRWGVSIRTLARWEAGRGRPAEWMCREMAAARSPLEWPTASVFRGLVENMACPAMIYDEHMTVLTASGPHRAWFHTLFNEDVIGVDWHRFMAEDTLGMLQKSGGLRYMIRHGLKSITGYYDDPRGEDGGFIPLRMFLELSVVRIPDYGNICVTFARQPKADDPLGAMRPLFLD